MTSVFNTKWEIGKPKSIIIPGIQMHTNQVFHCWNNPVLALFLKNFFYNIYDPILFEIEVDEIVSDNGIIFASKMQTITSKLDLPQINKKQQDIFCIRMAKMMDVDERLNLLDDTIILNNSLFLSHVYNVIFNVYRYYNMFTETEVKKSLNKKLINIATDIMEL